MLRGTGRWRESWSSLQAWAWGEGRFLEEGRPVLMVPPEKKCASNFFLYERMKECMAHPLTVTLYT